MSSLIRKRYQWLMTNIFLVVILSILSCNQNSPVDPPQDFGSLYKVPLDEGYGWEISTLEAEGFDQKLIEELLKEVSKGTYIRTHDIVLVRNGKLVLDVEYSEANAIRPGVAWLTQEDGSHYIASATKSIVATTVGIAIEQGLFKSERDSLYNHFSEFYDSFENWSDEKASITIEDLLTMRAGYKCEDGDGDTMWSIQLDMIKYILDRPMDYQPGTGFHYCSGNTNVLGDLIGRKSGLGYEEYLYQNLFEPMGIARPRYIVHQNSGKPRLGSGIFMQPRDMAKFGQLYLQGGVWNGQQLISKDWLEQTTEPVFILGDTRYYAHHWWRKDFKLNNEIHNIPYAAGNGGQVIYSYPEFDLVIVMTGGNYDDDLMFQNQEMIEKYILPSIIE